MKTTTRSFPLGQLLITPGARDTLDPQDVFSALQRHASGDWGDCDAEDWQENEFSLDKSLRLFSVYHDRSRTKFWIITEADRRSTCILLPDEY